MPGTTSTPAAPRTTTLAPTIRSVRNLSAESYHLAGKDAGNTPYVDLFDVIDADEAQALGFSNAMKFSADVAKATNKPDFDVRHRSALAAPLADFAAETTALGTAGDRRSEAQEAFDDVLRPSRTLRAAVTDLQAASELVLLSVFKGRRDLVDAILEPDARPRGPRKKKDPGLT